MKRKADINWKEVAAAQERGKRGRMLPGDQELCELAWRTDPERYSKQSKRIRDEITEEMRFGFPGKDR